MTLARTTPMKRTRKCSVKGCKEPAATFNGLKGWCTVDHGAVLAEMGLTKQKADKERKERKAAKEDRKQTREALLELKPRKWWKAKVKHALHAYIRARDEGKQCASCDTILLKLGRLGGDYDAGHFRSVGSAAHLAFEEKNIFGQCKHCNDALGGNSQEYERRLRILKGDAYVDEILADQAPRHYTIEDFQRIEATYKAKLKALKAGASAC